MKVCAVPGIRGRRIITSRPPPRHAQARRDSQRTYAICPSPPYAKDLKSKREAFEQRKGTTHWPDATIPPRRKAKVTLLITPRLHGPYQGSSANRCSRKHLRFPNSGILTSFGGGVTNIVTLALRRGGDSMDDI